MEEGRKGRKRGRNRLKIYVGDSIDRILKTKEGRNKGKGHVKEGRKEGREEGRTKEGKGRKIMTGRKMGLKVTLSVMNSLLFCFIQFRSAASFVICSDQNEGALFRLK